MDADTRDQFWALREDNRRLRDELRADIRRVEGKLDEHISSLGERCSRHGEEIAVLRSADSSREKRIDRKIAAGLLVIAAVSLLLKFLP